MNIQRWHRSLAIIIFVLIFLANLLSPSSPTFSFYRQEVAVFQSPHIQRAASPFLSQIKEKNIILNIGHRGAMGYEPENTLLSFKKAIEMNVDAIELDVRVCKGGDVVVIHDEKVDATTNGTGYVRDKTLQELKQLDAGKGQSVPTLKEVLNMVDKRVHVIIELKEKGIARPVSEIVERYVIEKHWNQEMFTISSFDTSELSIFRGLMPAISIDILGNPTPELSEWGRKLQAESLSVYFGSVTKDFIESVHSQNMKVFVWTVNRENDIANMKIIGVDGIITNFPNKI